MLLPTITGATWERWGVQWQHELQDKDEEGEDDEMREDKEEKGANKELETERF